MPLVVNSMFDDWMSLYTTKLESVCNIEDEELRRVFMLMQVLKWEFKRIENKIDGKLAGIKERLKDDHHNGSSLQPPSSERKSPILKKRCKLLPKKFNNTRDHVNTTLNGSIVNDNDKTDVHMENCIEDNDDSLLLIPGTPDKERSKKREYPKRQQTSRRILDIQQNQQPKYPYKTETVRRKIDRLKLPGWSCDQCKEYYEGFNLSSNELRRKMNSCSKHRNTFEPLTNTIAGYWDMDMPESQETDDNDITRIY